MAGIPDEGPVTVPISLLKEKVTSPQALSIISLSNEEGGFLAWRTAFYSDLLMEKEGTFYTTNSLFQQARGAAIPNLSTSTAPSLLVLPHQSDFIFYLPLPQANF